MYIPWIVMFLGFREISKKHKLFSLSNLHSSTILPTSPFFGEKCTLVYFLKNKQNSNPHSFCKVGQVQLWLIKTTSFIYLLLKIDPVIIRPLNFKFENVSFTKFQKKKLTIKQKKLEVAVPYPEFFWAFRIYVTGPRF